MTELPGFIWLNWSGIRNMKEKVCKMIIEYKRTSLLAVIFAILILSVSYLIYSLWFAKEKTSQIVDVSPLQSLNIPNKVDSISANFNKLRNTINLKEYELNVYDGINQKTKLKQPDEIKEWISFKYENGTGVYVNINLFYNSLAADKSYMNEYQNAENTKYGIYTYDSKNGIRYFSSYIERLRGDMFPAMLSDDYISTTVVQINNVVISIFEMSNSNKVIKKDEIIKLISDSLKKCK
ncbi:MAG: hypothetical protein Q8942_12470 [Bacillota bacterium]|nr:hypothetical protein [Bacillota bacterium]